MRETRTAGRSHRARTLAAVVVAGALLAACGGDDDEGESNQVSLQARFCELVGQFEATATTEGASSVAGVIDGPDDALNRLADAFGETLDEMTSSAPGEVRDDVERVVNAVKDRDFAAARSTEVAASVQAMTTYHDQSCPQPGNATSGES